MLNSALFNDCKKRHHFACLSYRQPTQWFSSYCAVIIHIYVVMTAVAVLDVAIPAEIRAARRS